MPLNLPGPVATYLAAVKARDVDMLALCFADDALVHDEDRDYRGLDAITSWKRETDAKYRYIAEPLDVAVDGNIVRLRARLTGNFPGIRSSSITRSRSKTTRSYRWRFNEGGKVCMA